MMRLSRIVFIAFLIAAIPVIACAEESKAHFFDSVECVSGFGMAKLRKVGTYHIVPLYVSFGGDLKNVPLIERINYPGRLEFAIEPFVSYVFDPDDNVEIGNNFVVKVGLVPEEKTFQPYLKGAVGVIYMTQDNKDQGSECNFTEYVGIGANYFFKKDTALTCEYRFRHISNLDIKEPNKGINTHVYLMGVTKRF